MRKTVLVLIVFMVFIGLSSVCAAEDNSTDAVGTEDIIQDDDCLSEDIETDEVGDVQNDGAQTKSFKDLQTLVSNSGVVYLEDDYLFNPENDSGLEGGVQVYSSVIYGNGHILDGNGSARIFKTKSTTLHDIVFKNACADKNGGAILASYQTTVINCTFINNRVLGNTGFGGAMHSGIQINCTFINNYAQLEGGALYSDSYSVNCTFINNTAEDRGGAIDGGSAVNCTFIGNCATLGGAISNGFASYTATATNCIFINNRANSNLGLIGNGGAMGQFGSLKVMAIECIFINNTADGKGDAMYSGEALNCTFIFNGISGTNAVDCEFPTPVLTASDFVSYLGSGDSLLFNLSHNGLLIKGFDTEIQISNDTFSDTFHALSGDDWPVNLALGVYSARLSLVGHPEVEIADATLTVLRKASIIINAPSTTYSYDDYAVAYLLDSETEIPIKEANLTVWINGGSEVYTTGADGGISVPTKNLAAGIHDFKVAFRTDAIHYKCEGIANLTVKKDASQLLASKVSTTFNVKKGMVITLKDSRGNPIIGADVSVSLDGVKTYKTDKNGQIRIDVHKLVPKTYNAKITFRENENYLASSASTKVTVKKAASKMAAKSKTFKTKDKNKKYSVKLKDNVGKVIKKAKITLKVNGKTYKAKTNAKGVATFKLKKLKKGTFKAKIAFKGNKYYKNTSKRVKLTVK